MKRLILQSNLILCLLLSVIAVHAQRPVSYDSPLREYNAAMELYQKHEYGAAQEYFQYVYENATEQQYDLKSTSYFYQGVCAVKLNHGDAAFLLRDFIKKYPIHTLVPEANFHIARSYFYQKQYKKSLEYFEEMDERKVNQDDLAEFYFKKGFCLLDASQKERKADKAAEQQSEARYYLRKALECDGQYQKKAVYYLAHLEYEQQQYEAALADFESIKDEKEFAKIVPSYILQIYFLQGEYQKVIDYSGTISAQNAEQAELDRIIGLSYYNLSNYQAAGKRFDDFDKHSSSSKSGAASLQRSDYYAFGFTRYKCGEYAEAIRDLSNVTDSADAMAQNAYYLIADCYLKQNKLPDASSFFYEASKMNYSSEIQEDAYYNYAKLQYETANAVNQHKALSTLEDYINRYPNSSRAQEMSSYLAAIYASTKNYTEAIKAIEKLDVNHKSYDILKSYQRCTHFRAMELIADKHYKDAIKVLDKSIDNPYDKELHRSNLYWKAEAACRAEEYKQAYNSFLIYQKTDNVTSDENYPISLYSFGYAALMIGKYKEAQKSFDKFLTFCNTEKFEGYESDVYARLGDCYFMQKQLKSAILNYEKCEQLKGSNADYALYQQSVCYGYQQNSAKKRELLEKFTKFYTSSPYITEVKFELAGIYFARDEYKLAINSYSAFIRDYPKSSFTPKAAYNLAQSYLYDNQVDKAISSFKEVVDKYPRTDQARYALLNLQEIYSDQGRPGEFLEYATAKGKGSEYTPAKQDSITYYAAEAKFMKGECDRATAGFTDYLKKFPDGVFAANAYFYRGECAYGNRSYDEALADYEYVIKNFRSENNEMALKKAATILYNKEEYARALVYFNDLLAASTTEVNNSYAYNGIMRCAFQQRNYRDALEGAKGFIASPKSDQDLLDDATLIAGKSAFELRDYSAAQRFLSPLAKASTNSISAEAAYYCALIEFKRQDYDACEKKITDIIESNYTSAYWIASTFILYGDYYDAIGNSFQARHTYQSIIDNYDGDELPDIARKRIEALDAKQKAAAPEIQDDEE